MLVVKEKMWIKKIFTSLKFIFNLILLCVTAYYIIRYYCISHNTELLLRAIWYLLLYISIRGE
jgi:hypothetical protein